MDNARIHRKGALAPATMNLRAVPNFLAQAEAAQKAAAAFLQGSIDQGYKEIAPGHFEKINEDGSRSILSLG